MSARTERITQLDSGLTVATDRVLGARSVAIGVWVAVGSRDEPADIAGVSHFLEHLVFKGSPTRSSIDISRQIDRIGGDVNAYTSKEHTTYYCRVPRRHVQVGIDLVGDVVTSPRLDPDDVERERLVILEELAMDDDSPDDVAHRRFYETVLPDDPMGWDSAGDRDTVEAITPDDVREFFNARYRTANTFISVAGDVDHDEIVARLATAFAPMPEGDGRVPRHVPGPLVLPAGGTTVLVDDDSEQLQLIAGGRGVSVADPRRPAVDVANHILGGGLSSRLFDEVRERRGLAYSVYSTSANFEDCGVWAVHLGTSPEHAVEVRAVLDDVVERFAADGVSAEETDIATGALVGSYEMGLEDTGARMARLGDLMVSGRPLEPVEEQLARWEAVTTDDVNAVAADVYGAPRVAVVVGPSETLTA